MGTAGDVTHELLGLSVELLEFAPIPGLRAVAKTLLNIWDAVEQVDVSFLFCVGGIDDEDDVQMNDLECLRLTERCAETLLDIRQQIFDAGDTVGQGLAPAIAQLEG